MSRPPHGSDPEGDRELLAHARRARSVAHAPYSRFRVGAALRTASGRVYPGCNVESVSYGLTICAERVAVFSAISDGERAFDALAIAVPDGQRAVPCGICRQLLAEFAPSIRLILSDGASTYRECSLADLLPDAGSPAEAHGEGDGETP